MENPPPSPKIPRIIRQFKIIKNGLFGIFMCYTFLCFIFIFGVQDRFADLSTFRLFNQYLFMLLAMLIVSLLFHHLIFLAEEIHNMRAELSRLQSPPHTPPVGSQPPTAGQ